jgi:hypothetical protein
VSARAALTRRFACARAAPPNLPVPAPIPPADRGRCGRRLRRRAAPLLRRSRPQQRRPRRSRPRHPAAHPARPGAQSRRRRKRAFHFGARARAVNLAAMWATLLELWLKMWLQMLSITLPKLPIA